MVILAVDNNMDRLRELVKNLKAAFPGSTVEHTHDPLAAGKFGINNTVDILFAGQTMKRLDGIPLSNIIRKKNPHLKLFLYTDMKKIESASLDTDHSVEYIPCPVTKEKLDQIALQYYIQNK